MSLNYTGLRKLKAEDRARASARLLKMRERLEPLRARKRENALLLATWNLRDFDSNKFGWGKRLPESFYYIAEIISCFDLVAIQEVTADLAPFRKLMSILGREWDYIVTDVTAGTSGNQERMAYVWNTEKVFFRKVAGEIVLPKGQLIVTEKLAETETGEDLIEKVENQFARTPFLVAFQSGWFKFNLCTVHIYFGASSGAKLQRRIREIERLMKFFRTRQDKENARLTSKPEQAENYILLGDFNVVSPEHETMQALESQGFEVPDAIDGDIVRPEEGKYYDQIAVRAVDPRFRLTGGGVVNMFEDVFRNRKADRELYEPMIPAGQEPDLSLETRYKKWRTWQMSDHSPLWVEIETDFSDHYLKSLKD